MGIFNNNNNFNPNYKKRPFDSYKSVVDKLDEETKQRLDRQRQKGMLITIVFVFLLVVILAVTGIGIDKTKSVSGNIFADKENVLIECFGDSLTEGFTVQEAGGSAIVENTYPEELKEKLPQLFSQDDKTWKFKNLEVKNYGQSGSILAKNSSSRLSGNADIVVMQYIANNFINGEDYAGIIEENAEAIRKAGAALFILNYPYAKGTAYEEKLEQANNCIAAAARDLSIPLIDIHEYFDTLEGYSPDQLFSPDNLHLTPKGYELMGDYVSQEIHEYYYNMF